MINIVNSSGKTTYDIQTYVCDTEADLVELEAEKPQMGSTVYVIETKKSYIFNSSGETVELPEGGSGGGGVTGVTGPKLRAFCGWGNF